MQWLREDRRDETEFITISYWESVEALARFTGDRDPEFPIELPQSVQVLEIIASGGHCGGDRD